MNDILDVIYRFFAAFLSLIVAFNDILRIFVRILRVMLPYIPRVGYK